MTQDEALLTVFRNAEPSLRRNLDPKRAGRAVNGHTGDDLRQITALRCVEYTRANGTPPPSVAYVVRMGLNARADVARKCRPEEIPEEQLDKNLSRESDPAEAVVKKEELSLLHAALASLLPGDMDIIRLHVLESRSLKSVADDLGRKAPTIRIRFERAMARLKAKLKEYL